MRDHRNQTCKTPVGPGVDVALEKVITEGCFLFTGGCCVLHQTAACTTRLATYARVEADFPAAEVTARVQKAAPTGACVGCFCNTYMTVQALQSAKTLPRLGFSWASCLHSHQRCNQAVTWNHLRDLSVISDTVTAECQVTFKQLIICGEPFMVDAHRTGENESTQKLLWRCKAFYCSNYYTCRVETVHASGPLASCL